MAVSGISSTLNDGPAPTRPLSMPTDSPKLDALRTFAVLAVFVDHFSQIWGSENNGWRVLIELGRMGVLLFFVHTSLVLMFSLERHNRRFGPDRQWSTFMIRRAFRIYPLSVVFVLAVFIFHIPSMDTTLRSVQYEDVGLHGLVVNLALIQNVPNIGAPSIMGVLWSLPWEVQMYAALPFIFLMVRAIRSPYVLLATTIFLFALFNVVHPWEHSALWMFQFVPSFLSGIVAYSFWNRWRPRLPFWAFALVLAGVSVLFMSYSGYAREAMLGLVVGCAIPLAKDPTSKVFNTFCKHIAMYSYGFYLAHVLCTWLAFDAMKSYPLAVQWVTFAVVLVGVPVVAYHGIERPMMQVGAKLATRWQRSSPRFWERFALRPLRSQVD